MIKILHLSEFFYKTNFITLTQLTAKNTIKDKTVKTLSKQESAENIFLYQVCCISKQQKIITIN